MGGHTISPGKVYRAGGIASEHRRWATRRSLAVGPKLITGPLQQCLQAYQETGQFGSVQLGMSREQLQAILGEPECTGGTSRKQKTPLAWKYGGVEFHFRQSGELWLIYSEDEAGEVSLVVEASGVET